MIDLRSSNEVLSRYVERYDHLLPQPTAQLRQRMEHDLQPDALELARQKPQWLSSRHCSLSNSEALDRAKGCLLGLAVGDAVGTTLEFLPRDRSHVQDMVGGGPFKLKAGEGTDDTSMALCLADTYLSHDEFDFSDYADRLSRWFRVGENSHNGKCFDIGNATNLADDADSVAAVAGQLAGALYGASGIPEEWVTKAAWSVHIPNLAFQLHEQAPDKDQFYE
jgi:ADP-ribosylglycohydrolase